MSKNLSKQFRKALLNYLKDPLNIKKNESLASSALAIFNEAVKKKGISADQYMNHIEQIVEASLEGIRIPPNVAINLDTFNRSVSSSVKYSGAFHPLTMTYDVLIHPARSSLKKIIHDFLMVQNELGEEALMVTSRKNLGSFFINNVDITT